MYIMLVYPSIVNECTMLIYPGIVNECTLC